MPGWLDPIRRVILAQLALGLGLVALLRLTHFLKGPSVLALFWRDDFPWFSLCLVASVLVHAITAEKRERWLLVPIAALLEASNLMGAARPSWFPPFGVCSAVSALLLRLALASRATGAPRLLHARASFDSLVPPGFGLISTEMLMALSRLTPHVRDLEIQNIGGWLGPWPPIVLGHWFRDVPGLAPICTLVYMFMPIGLSVVHAFALRADPTRRPSLLWALVLIPLFGYPLYYSLPMVGPREAWHALKPAVVFPPEQVPKFITTTLIVPAFAPRNCMPSLHTAWTLSAVLQARQLGRPLLLFASFWFLGTELATLGLGEHWLIDLVVAVPFTFAVNVLAEGTFDNPGVRRNLVLWIALVVGWMLALTLARSVLLSAPTLTAIGMLATPAIAMGAYFRRPALSISPERPADPPTTSSSL